MRLYTRPQQWRMHAYNESEPRDYLSPPLSLFRTAQERKKEEERRRAARRFMTFHNRNVYTRPEGARLKKNKEREREKK